MVSRELASSVELLSYGNLTQNRRDSSLSSPSRLPGILALDGNLQKDIISFKTIRVVIRAIASIPYLTSWIYWLSKPNAIPKSLDQIPVYFTVIGYTFSFFWLLLTSFCKLSMALKLGTYYSLVFCPASFAAVICSFYSGSSVIGFCLISGTLLLALDCVLCFFFFPPIKILSPQLAVEEASSDSFYATEGPAFEYVPLDGGSRLPLEEYSDFNQLVKGRTKSWMQKAFEQYDEEDLQQPSTSGE